MNELLMILNSINWNVNDIMKKVDNYVEVVGLAEFTK